MVFSSYEFIFFFLPVVYAVFVVLDRFELRRARLGWLLAASLVFYSWWNPVYLPLIVGSVAFNLFLGRALYRRSKTASASRKRWPLALGVGANLALLAWFKYANFFVETADEVLATGFVLEPITLPLAISFFTFQQIAYLTDSHRGATEPHGALPYAVFVTFFPQLIAGPIIRHNETISQIDRRQGRFRSSSDFAVGSALFTFGLFKKVVLADGIAEFATPVFDAAAAGGAITLLEAWGGALAYTLQIYFDFSGYTDMAIGGARLFGIRLPVNFDSPYRAVSIVNFWQRWHITLSRFLRDYLYIPLGGNRRGTPRRYGNLMATMLLGGLWHGAGWTFVLWGGLHGFYLLANHGWRALRSRLGWQASGSRWARGSCRLITFLCVVVAWVLFRAESLDAAMQLYQGMAGWNGVSVSPTSLFEGWQQIVLTGLLLVLAGAGPNTQELLGDFDPALPGHRPSATAPLGRGLRWRPNARWAVLMAGLAVASILVLERSDEFLYFQF
ncbi:MAG: MBOAT family O-acyltransferase [Planctomycetota bacterium]|jgi:D-alanyl-lipoteichoic acid acyltransferase DltB (MBOAT superfamily)